MTISRSDIYKLIRKQRQKRDEISKYVRYSMMPFSFNTDSFLYELALKFHTYPTLIGRQVMRIHEYYRQ